VYKKTSLDLSVMVSPKAIQTESAGGLVIGVVVGIPG